MTEHNLPDKDDAPWLDTTYDGFKIQEQGQLMTEDNKFALKEFLRGAAFTTIGFVGVLIIGFAMLSVGEDETPMNSHAEVVDTYKGCDIVRWSTSRMAEYKYFLYCEKDK